MKNSPQRSLLTALLTLASASATTAEDTCECADIADLQNRELE